MSIFIIIVCILLWLLIGVYTMFKTAEVYPIQLEDVHMIPVCIFGGPIAYMAYLIWGRPRNNIDFTFIDNDSWKKVKQYIRNIFT